MPFRAALHIRVIGLVGILLERIRTGSLVPWSAARSKRPTWDHLSGLELTQRYEIGSGAINTKIGIVVIAQGIWASEQAVAQCRF
jgi:hypothetical protein